MFVNHTVSVPREAREGIGSPGTRVTDNFLPPCESGSPEEQSVF